MKRLQLDPLPGDPPKEISIRLQNGHVITFIGRYRRDLEKAHWHYYETIDGVMHHFKKDAMIHVTEREVRNA